MEKTDTRAKFKYSKSTIELKLLDIQRNGERDLQEQFRVLNLRKYIEAYEAGYLQALNDYKVDYPK